MADPAYYRTREEEKLWKGTRDPITLFEEKLKEAGMLRDEDIRADQRRRWTRRSRSARASPTRAPTPTWTRSTTDVTIENGSGAIAWRSSAASYAT